MSKPFDWKDIKNFDEISLSDYFVELHDDEMRYVDRKWFVYDQEKGWVPDRRLRVFSWVKQFCAEVADAAINGFAQPESVGKRIASIRTANAILALSRCHEKISVTAQELDDGK